MSDPWTCDEEVWGQCTIVVAGRRCTVDEFTPDVIKKLARENGLKKFVVKDAHGKTLAPDELPREGELKIEQYDEPRK